MAITSFVTKGFVVQKISPRLTILDILNHHCYLAFDHSNLIFSLGTLAYDDLAIIKKKSGCKRINTSEEVESESKSGYAKEQASKTQQ